MSDEYIKKIESEYSKNERNISKNNNNILIDRIDKAIELNGKILNMIDDGRSREQFLPYLKEQQEILKGSDK